MPLKSGQASTAEAGSSRSGSVPPSPAPARRSKTWGPQNNNSDKNTQTSVVLDSGLVSGESGTEDAFARTDGAPIRRARSFSSGIDKTAMRARICITCTHIFEAAASAGLPPPQVHWSSIHSGAAAKLRAGSAAMSSRQKEKPGSGAAQTQRRGLSFACDSDSSVVVSGFVSPSAFVSATTSGLNSGCSSETEGREATAAGQKAQSRRHQQRQRADSARVRSSGDASPQGAPPAHVLGRYLVSSAQALTRHGSGTSKRSRGDGAASGAGSASHRGSSCANSPISVTVFAMSADSDAEEAADRIRRAGSGGAASAAAGRSHRTSEDSSVWPVTAQQVPSTDDALFVRHNTQASAPSSPPGEESPTFAGRYSRPASSERTSGVGYLGEDTSDPEVFALHMFAQRAGPMLGPGVVVLPGTRPDEGIQRLGTPPTPERVLSEAISLSSGKDGADASQRVFSFALDTVSDSGVCADDISGPSMLQRAVSTESEEGVAQASGRMDPTPPGLVASPLRCRTGPLPSQRGPRLRSTSGGAALVLALPSQPIVIPQDKTEPQFAVDRDGNRTSAGLRTRRAAAVPGGGGTALPLVSALPAPAPAVRRHRTDMGPRATATMSEELGTGYFDAVDATASRLARFREKRAEVAAANMQAAFAAGVLQAPAERQPTSEYTTTYTCRNCKNVFAPGLSGFEHYCSRDCHTMATLHGVSTVGAP